MAARRVIRPETVTDCDGKWRWKPGKGFDRTAYRIEWPDGEPTGTGLFVSLDAAGSYAQQRGWPVDVENEEECA